MVNSRRFDPYKSFKFILSFGAVSLAAFGVARKLLKGPSAKSRKKPKPSVEEADSGARPIEAVGTSTAGFAGTTPKKRTKPRSAAVRKRASARKPKP